MCARKTDLALMLRGEQFTGVEFVTDSDARAIEVHVANLRRKLGESPATPGGSRPCAASATGSPRPDATTGRMPLLVVADEHRGLDGRRRADRGLTRHARNRSSRRSRSCR